MADEQTEDNVSSFLDGQGPGNETEPIENGSVDDKEAAREAEEEGEQLEEDLDADPADEVEVQTNGEQQDEEDGAEDQEQDPGENQEAGDEEGASEGEAGEDDPSDEEDLDVELDDDLAAILDDSREPGGEDSEPIAEDQQEESDDRIDQLMNKIEELEGRLDGDGAEEGESRAANEPTQQDHIEFVENEEELQDLTEDVDSFNELMSRMFHTVREEVTRVVPEIAHQTMKQRQSVQKAVKGFWKENPDLQDWEKQVQAVAQEVQAQNPNADHRTILDKSGEVVRERLDLHKQAKEANEGSDDSSENQEGLDQPPTPGGSSAGPPSQGNMSETEEEVSEMLEATEH